MSDGNYNKNLLPYRDYQSGYRAGSIRMKVKAKTVLKELLEKSSMPAEETEKLLQDFSENL